MLYRLVKITDLHFKDKTNDDALNRIDRVFDIQKENIECGKSFFMNCVSPGFDKSVITSWVMEVINADDGIIKMENSYYYLVENEKYLAEISEQQIYICIESFNIQNDYYGTNYGNVRSVNVGDEYYLLREPTPEKKLYKLKKVDDKFDNHLYLRKNDFKRYFTKKPR